MALPSLVALEIGTAHVRALVGEEREDGVLMVTGRGECRSAGIRKGAVVDHEHALSCVRAALEAAEEQANLTVQQVHLVLSGADIRSETNRGIVHVLDDEGEITAEEMRQAQANARKITLSSDRDVLHSVPQRYFVDEQEGVVNPEGMEGRQLALDMLIIHGQRTPLRNTILVAQKIPVDVEDVAFGGLCSALAVLTPEQKRSGVAVIDLGAGATDLLVYTDRGMTLAASLAVGGDHVTNDMALGLRIPTAQAERLKRQHACALTRGGGSASVTLPAEGGFAGRTIRRADLDRIVHARMDEILGLLVAGMQKEDVLSKIGAGVVLTGGGAHMPGITDLAERKFRAPCSVGRPRGYGGMAAILEGPENAAVAGMLRYAAATGTRGGRKNFRGLIASLLDAVRPTGRRGGTQDG